MVKRWFTIGAGFVLVVGIGIVALNYDKSDHTQRIGTPVASSSSPDMRSPSDSSTMALTESSHEFESQSERIEAQMLAELDTFNQDIADAKRQLDEETVIAQSEEESPELVLAKASMILSELEQEGIVFTYDPVLLTPDTPSTQAQVIEKQVVEVEDDLIDIEQRFNNLGNNKESL